MAKAAAEVPQFEAYFNYVEGQRITHHSGSIWIVRELHRELEFVVPDEYTIECETAGGGDEAGNVLRRSREYVHGSFRPTPNIAGADVQAHISGPAHDGLRRVSLVIDGKLYGIQGALFVERPVAEAFVAQIPASLATAGDES